LQTNPRPIVTISVRAALVHTSGVAHPDASRLARSIRLTFQISPGQVRCLLNGHAVPGLEETFAALRALRPSFEHRSSEGDVRNSEVPSSQSGAFPTDERRPEAVTRVVDQASRVHTDDADALTRLDALRAQKKAADARRKRLTVSRTLAGNPGQLSLFG